MAFVYVLLLVTVCLAAFTEASEIFFPDQLQHNEHDSCNTHLGTDGKCERSCRHSSSQSELLKCGIKDSSFLYCCDSNLREPTEGVPDNSTPFLTFLCGENSKNEFKFQPYFGPPAAVLRPGASLPPPGIKTTIARSFFPSDFSADSFKYMNVTTRKTEVFPNVVGGINAEKNAWPWMALVGRKTTQGNAWFCGGALINEQWVLSAYHCFLYFSAQVVRLGEHDYSTNDEGSSHEDFDVAETVLYPDYKHPHAYHDLALLRLASKVTLQKFIRPVCLPWGIESDSEITGHIATLTGWGDTEFGGFPSTVLQEVNVTIFTVDQCDRSYSRLPGYAATWPQGIGGETLCAGDPNGGRDACQGDSGGPLVTRVAHKVYVLAGIVSRGYGCGLEDYPGLYANVRHPPYLAWIKKVAFVNP